MIAATADEDDLVAQAVDEAARDMGLGPDEKVHTLDDKIELARRVWRKCQELSDDSS